VTYTTVILSELLSETKKNIYCFGAGQIFADFVNEFKTYNLEDNIKAVVDNNSNIVNFSVKTVCDVNIPIISFEEMIGSIKKDDKILITTVAYEEIIEQIKKTKRYLSRIQFISVREKAGAKIVKELINRDVPVVCDPTALLTVEQWDEIKSSKVYSSDNYIFCYFLGANPLHREFANKLKQLTGYQIVALQHIDEFVEGDLNNSRLEIISFHLSARR